MVLMAVNTAGIVPIDHQGTWRPSGGRTGWLVVLGGLTCMFSLASLASTSCLSTLTIFQLFPSLSRIILRRASIGNFYMMTRVSMLPYRADVTSRVSKPHTWTMILSYTERIAVEQSAVQPGIFNNSSIWAAITSLGLPNVPPVLLWLHHSSCKSQDHSCSSSL